MTNEWQPIDTAPKDGTPILITTNRVPEKMVIALWNENWSSAEGDGHRPLYWMPLPELPV